MFYNRISEFFTLHLIVNRIYRGF